MQFRNKSDDDRSLTLDGVRLEEVARGESIVVTADEAPGLVLQCGPDGAWEPADDEAAAAVAAASGDTPTPARPKRTKPDTTTTEESA